MIRRFDDALDANLDELGYKIVDPVAVLIMPTDSLLKQLSKPGPLASTLETPDTYAKAIWKSGGIDQPRLDVMSRVEGAKTYLNAQNMRVAFAACHNRIAMVHAVEVSKEHRRKGVANALMHQAAIWAKQKGCTWVTVLTVRANAPACALYKHLGMKEAAAYHYRLLAQD